MPQKDGLENETFRAWMLGSKLGEQTNVMKTICRGKVVFYDDSQVNPEAFERARVVALERLDRNLRILSACYEELKLGTVRDLRPEIRKMVDSFSGLSAEGLSNEKLVESLENVFHEWSVTITIELAAKTNFTWSAGQIGYHLMNALLYYQILTERKADGSGYECDWMWTPKANRKKGSHHPEPTIREDADDVYLAFPKDTVDLITHSLAEWEKFEEKRTDGDRKTYRFEINTAIRDQYQIWASLLQGQREPERFLRERDKILISAVPVASVVSIISAFIVVFYAILLLFNLGLSVESLSRIDDTLKLILSGGLAAMVSSLIRVPFQAIKTATLRSRARRATTRLPRLKDKKSGLMAFKFI